jgi:hypothetical protein
MAETVGIRGATMPKIDSSSIAQVDYDDRDSILLVKFQSGSRYAYLRYIASAARQAPPRNPTI